MTSKNIMNNTINKEQIVNWRFYRNMWWKWDKREIEVLPKLTIRRNLKPGNHELYRNNYKWIGGFSINFQWLCWGWMFHVCIEYQFK